MKKYLIPIAVTALLSSWPARGATNGVIVLEDTPGCDYFIVETRMGYSLLEWYGGVISVWEGDRVFGDLESYGFKDIHIDGRGEMRVWIEDYWASEDDAVGYFRSNCN